MKYIVYGSPNIDLVYYIDNVRGFWLVWLIVLKNWRDLFGCICQFYVNVSTQTKQVASMCIAYKWHSCARSFHIFPIVPSVRASSAVMSTCGAYGGTVKPVCNDHLYN